MTYVPDRDRGRPRTRSRSSSRRPVLVEDEDEGRVRFVREHVTELVILSTEKGEAHQSFSRRVAGASYANSLRLPVRGIDLVNLPLNLRVELEFVTRQFFINDTPGLLNQ